MQKRYRVLSTTDLRGCKLNGRFIQVIARNASLTEAHEMKRRAFHKLARYDKVIETLNELPDGRQCILLLL